MLNINDLETRWFRYKLKYYLPFIVLTLLIIITIFVTYKLLLTTQTSVANLKTQIIEPPKVLQKAEADISAIHTNESVKVVKIDQVEQEPIQKTYQEPAKENKLILQPSFKTIDNINETSFKKQIASKEKTEPIIKQNLVEKEKPVQKLSPVIKAEPSKVDEPLTIKENSDNNLVQIKRQNTKNDIQHVIKRFKKSNNPALSLFIAKKYYELGDYHQAYNYAFITNEINNDIEESWLIFSKALVKLDEKEKAVSVLRKYIQSSHSQRAQVLLKNILSGKLE